MVPAVHRIVPGRCRHAGVNYRLADLLLENEDFLVAAKEYEKTGYEYAEHSQSSAAGYAAVYAYRQELNKATGVRQREIKRETVTSSLRFADTYPDHEEASIVLEPPPTISMK